MRGVDFVASNMIIKINPKGCATEEVRILNVVVAGEKETGTANAEDWG